MKMEELVNYCKQYGFIFQGSEIYGGLSNTWDYGSLGRELKENIRRAWWKKFIQENPNNYGLDAAILMNPETWVASGHVTSFNDPLIDCKKCKSRHRADKLIEEFTEGKETGDGWDNEKIEEFIKDNKITCPKCGSTEFTPIRKFNLLFETHIGVTEDSKSKVYLRGETAQGIFVNFLNVQRTMRAKLPFGVGQIGKAFRNEITPGNFNFRTIEFEQMEFQTFCKKGNDSEIYNYFKEYAKQFFKDLGLSVDNLRFHDHEKLAHYAKEACDIEYKFPFGWGEINGTHNRTDYDLKRHQEYSGKSMEYLDMETNEKYIPYIIESTIGPDRTVLAVLCEAYTEEILDNNETRIVLKLNPVLSPYKIAILPLTKKQSEKSKEIFRNLSKEFMCTYDEAGTIGKRYRRQDEIGTPYCITIDYYTEKDDCVTIRNRDTMEQERIKIEEICDYIQSKLKKYMI